MSFEPAAPARAGGPEPHRRLTETERNWLASAAILFGGIAAFAGVHALELDLGRWNGAIRLVLEPAQSCMVYLGISHFLVALFYTATSKRMRSTRAWARFAGLLAAGAVLCVGFGGLRVINPILAGVLFFGYFLVHDFRDQVFFYFVNGDEHTTVDKNQKTTLARALLFPPFLFVGAVAALLGVLLVARIPGSERFESFFGATPIPLRWAVIGFLLIVLAAAGLRWRSLWKQERLGDFATFFQLNRPIYTVFGGSLAILAAGLWLGWRGYSIVILHVAAWYVFSLRQLKKATAKPIAVRPIGLSWLRQMPAGFNLVHVGSAVLLLLAGLVWAYGFRNDPKLLPFSILLGKDNFQYWTILHVTVSLSSR